jgi:hypothetical protein
MLKSRGREKKPYVATRHKHSLCHKLGRVNASKCVAGENLHYTHQPAVKTVLFSLTCENIQFAILGPSSVFGRLTSGDAGPENFILTGDVTGLNLAAIGGLDYVAHPSRLSRQRSHP